MKPPLTCRVLGHRWYFDAEGSTLTWSCARGCAVGGSRDYPTAEQARARAAVLNRGAPRPPLGLLSALAGTVHREPKQPGS
ncbi:MAG: hypothetical protein ACRDPB_03020 [Nocardioidaceae bacterium]